MTNSHKIFRFHFVADLHTQEGRNIASAAHTELRLGEIDNDWKDTVGRGAVDSIRISLGRVESNRKWSLGARSTDDDYDRELAAQLRTDVLAALKENADEYEEFRSELYEPPT